MADQLFTLPAALGASGATCAATGAATPTAAPPIQATALAVTAAADPPVATPDNGHLAPVDHKIPLDTPHEPSINDGGCVGENQYGPSKRGLPPPGITPPIEGPVVEGDPSRPSERDAGGRSLWDKHGGEWRYFPGDKYHNPHWDYNPHDKKNSPWQNEEIGGAPPHKTPITLTPTEKEVAGGIGIIGILAGIGVILGKLTHPLSPGFAP